MDKKGFSYVDVAVSVGIFLLGIIIALVLMRQGIKTEDTGSLILPDIRYRFENYTSYTIYRHPFFISNIPGNTPTHYQIQFPFNYNPRNIKLVDYHFNDKQLSINSLTTVPIIQFSDTIPDDKKHIYYILYSDQFNFNNNNNPSITLDNPAQNTYQIGLSDQITGISVDKFNNLPSYNILKDTLKIPTYNDFSIFIYDPQMNNVLYSYDNVQPTEDKQVYVLQYSAYLLYDNSTRRPVTVNIRTW